MVKHLMANFKIFSKMGSKMKDLMPRGMSMKEFANYNPMEGNGRMTPKQIRALNSMIPAQAMQQLGGTQGLMNIMKQMANMKKK